VKAEAAIFFFYGCLNKRKAKI